jgi:hypothetical protein
MREREWQGLVDELKARYRLIHGAKGYPKLTAATAFDVPPSIPFVGREYLPARRLLVYGSAESLSWYSRQPGGFPEWLLDDRARDRHRLVFEKWQSEAREVEATPFPNVHIQPVNDGGLLIAAAFVESLGNRPGPDEPVDFIESIAVGNFSKFAIKDSTNVDPGRNEEWLAWSLPYVEADLELLKPRWVLVTKSTAELKSVHSVLRRHLKEEQILSVMQCQPKNVRFHLGRFHAAGEALMNGSSMATGGRPNWHRWLEAFNESVMKRHEVCTYLAHVEDRWRERPRG